MFASVEDGDKITMVNHRSKKEYTWRYRNLRKEGELKGCSLSRYQQCLLLNWCCSKEVVCLVLQ